MAGIVVVTERMTTNGVDVLLGIYMKATGRLDSFIADLEKQRALPQSTRRLLLALKASEK